jgi:hypothetical protein
MYQPPLWELRRDRLPELPAALRIPMLIIAFDTELHMSGIHGFLEHSTGAYLSETIDALAAIGAHATAATMAGIRTVLTHHGVNLSDREGIQKFHWDHWEESDALSADIDAAARDLYLYSRPPRGENVLGMVQQYIDANRDALLHAVRTWTGSNAG